MVTKLIRVTSPLKDDLIVYIPLNLRDTIIVMCQCVSMFIECCSSSPILSVAAMSLLFLGSFIKILVFQAHVHGGVCVGLSCYFLVIPLVTQYLEMWPLGSHTFFRWP